MLLTAVAAALIGPANASGAFGQSPAEFAADSDAVLWVAGWAFSIWGPLYAGVLAFAVWQLRDRSDDPLLRRLGWPAAAAFAGLAAWIVAAGADAEAATAAIIIAALFSLLLPLWALGAEVRAAFGRTAGWWSGPWPPSPHG